MVQPVNPGTNANPDEILDEMANQLVLFKTNASLFKAYIKEYTVSCLIDKDLKKNLKKCSQSVISFLSEVKGIDVGRYISNNDLAVKKKVLEANMASIERFGINPEGVQININNQPVTVGCFQLGGVH